MTGELNAVRAYPENVVLDWCPINGPESAGFCEVHPWKQKDRDATKAITNATSLLNLMLLNVRGRSLLSKRGFLSFYELSRILEKQNWLQMSQVFFCIRTLSLGGFAFQGFYKRDRGT